MLFGLEPIECCFQRAGEWCLPVREAGRFCQCRRLQVFHQHTEICHQKYPECGRHRGSDAEPFNFRAEFVDADFFPATDIRQPIPYLILETDAGASIPQHHVLSLPVLALLFGHGRFSQIVSTVCGRTGMRLSYGCGQMQSTHDGMALPRVQLHL